MDCIAQRIPYRQTNSFSRIAIDYIDQSPVLRPFFAHPPTVAGLKQAIESRKQSDIDRQVLVNGLKKQYAVINDGSVIKRIEQLSSPDTFTITTAHQPNVLTGPLYVIYKIVHAINLAKHCKNQLPEFDFVPVFYMGSEDADLDELGHIHIDGKKYEWKTRQTGAVGRMKVDHEFLCLLDEVEGRLAVLPDGKEIVSLARSCYTRGTLIQDATFSFLHALFGHEGLIVFIPDDATYKRQMQNIFEDDLFLQKPSELVGDTIREIERAGYKVQANPREINLFYLVEGVRERITKGHEEFKVVNTEINFTGESLRKELSNHPERFSPNVILRGIFQVSVLPDVVFIGGGGELAYWLQYKKLFENYNVPMPMLVLRNSFLFLEKSTLQKLNRVGLEIDDFFSNTQEILSRLVENESKNRIRLNGVLEKTEEMYETIRMQAGAIDESLTRHVEALKSRAVQRLVELEKKMLRAEKRKFTDQLRQIEKIKAGLFPANSLQERHDNLLFYYAKYGKGFLQTVKKNSLNLEQEFTIVTISE